MSKVGKGNPPVHTRFKPGQSGNPSGKRRQMFTKEALDAVIDKFMFMDRVDIQAVIKDPESPMIEIMAANIVIQAALKADHARAEWLAQRRIGKVKDQLEVSTPEPFIVKRKNGEEIEAGMALPEKEGGE